MTSSKPHFHIFRVAAVMITVALALPGSDAQTITTIASTISSNGDLNPYGVAQVPATSGALIKGDILVSNFNNSSNLQGRGTTIVQISPSGTVSLFAQVDPNPAGALSGWRWLDLGVSRAPQLPAEGHRLY
jgi:hypothetical protein